MVSNKHETLALTLFMGNDITEYISIDFVYKRLNSCEEILMWFIH